MLSSVMGIAQLKLFNSPVAVRWHGRNGTPPPALKNSLFR